MKTTVNCGILAHGKSEIIKKDVVGLLFEVNLFPSKDQREVHIIKVVTGMLSLNAKQWDAHFGGLLDYIYNLWHLLKNKQTNKQTKNWTLVDVYSANISLTNYEKLLTESGRWNRVSCNLNISTCLKHVLNILFMFKVYNQLMHLEKMNSQALVNGHIENAIECHKKEMSLIQEHVVEPHQLFATMRNSFQYCWWRYIAYNMSGAHMSISKWNIPNHFLNTFMNPEFTNFEDVWWQL